MPKDLFNDLYSNIDEKYQNEKYQRKNDEATFEENVIRFDKEILALSIAKQDTAWALKIDEINKAILKDPRYKVMLNNYVILEAFLPLALKLVALEQVKQENIAKAKDFDKRVEELNDGIRNFKWCSTIDKMKRELKLMPEEVKGYSNNINLFNELCEEQEMVSYALKVNSKIFDLSKKELNLKVCDEIINCVFSLTEDMRKYMSNYDLAISLDKQAREYIDNENIKNAQKAFEKENVALENKKNEAQAIDELILKVDAVRKNERDIKWCNEVKKIVNRFNQANSEVRNLMRYKEYLGKLEKNSKYIASFIEIDERILKYSKEKINCNTAVAIMKFYESLKYSNKEYLKNVDLLEEINYKAQKFFNPNLVKPHK